MVDRNGGARTASFALTGSGGSGVMTAGEMLLDAAANAGWYGVMTRSLGPQVRGGEAAAFVRLGDAGISPYDDTFDILLAFDWESVIRFADELALGSESVVICEASAGEPPAVIAGCGARFVRTVPLYGMMPGRAVFIDQRPDPLPSDVIYRQRHTAGGIEGERYRRSRIEGIRVILPQAERCRPVRLNTHGNIDGIGAARIGIAAAFGGLISLTDETHQRTLDGIAPAVKYRTADIRIQYTWHYQEQQADED